MHLKSAPEVVHMIFAAALLAVLLSCTMIATADTNAESAATTAIVKKPNPNQRICKRVKPTGSHISRRVCLKQKQWEAMQEEAQRLMRDRKHRSTGSQEG
jgi:hypothetical protein